MRLIFRGEVASIFSRVEILGMAVIAPAAIRFLLGPVEAGLFGNAHDEPDQLRNWTEPLSVLVDPRRGELSMQLRFLGPLARHRRQDSQPVSIPGLARTLPGLGCVVREADLDVQITVALDEVDHRLRPPLNRPNRPPALPSDGNKNKNCDNSSLRGNASSCKVKKLRRDCSEAVERLERGEFKSVAAAERFAKGGGTASTAEIPQLTDVGNFRPSFPPRPPPW
jgi:hypothetical protein